MEDRKIDEPTVSEAAAAQPQEADLAGLVRGVLGGQAGDLVDKISDILPEGALDQASRALDRDGDGNPLDDLANLAGRYLRRD